jgi:hypothetical protein
LSAPSRSRIATIIAAMLAMALFSACDEPAPPAAAIPPVRFVTVEPLDVGQALSQADREVEVRLVADPAVKVVGRARYTCCFKVRGTAIRRVNQTLR